MPKSYSDVYGASDSIISYIIYLLQCNTGVVFKSIEKYCKLKITKIVQMTVPLKDLNQKLNGNRHYGLHKKVFRRTI
jgi:hypothetical protein